MTTFTLRAPEEITSRLTSALMRSWLHDFIHQPHPLPPDPGSAYGRVSLTLPADVVSHTRIVVHAGKLFWEHAMQMPMTGDGKVAWPKMEAVRGGTWNRKEFGVMPGFEKEEKMTEAFGVEEAK